MYVNTTHSPDFDSLSAAASAALAISITSAHRVDGDSSLSACLAELERLPQWRDDSGAWRSGLSAFLNPFRSASDEELARRSPALSWLLRVCHSVEDACAPTWGAETRHRSLLQAGMYTGILARLVHDEEEANKRLLAALTGRAKHAAAARHKDHKADKEHVREWLGKNRQQYSSDAKRIDAIIATKEVSAARATIQKWVTQWNGEQRQQRS